MNFLKSGGRDRIEGRSVLRENTTNNGSKLVFFGVSTLAGITFGIIVLIAINASMLKVPVGPQTPSFPEGQTSSSQTSVSSEPDYKSITERNLFRAKLQIEIPKPKTEKELEEEALTAIIKTMALKGVMLGVQKKDHYAVIDRGGPKGVWVYEIGEVVERGLAVKEIRKDSIKLEKGDFAAVLKLFSSTYERAPGMPASPVAARPRATPSGQNIAKMDLGKEIRRDGNVTLISKSLAEKLKVDNNVIMSSIAVKAAADGLKVVAVDKGSIAQKMGIAADDTLQEVNGHRLSSTGDMNKVYEALKNATRFEVKVMRRGKEETLRYEIR
jgi:type II secretory pathway component PulC